MIFQMINIRYIRQCFPSYRYVMNIESVLALNHIHVTALVKTIKKTLKN